MENSRKLSKISGNLLEMFQLFATLNTIECIIQSETVSDQALWTDTLEVQAGVLNLALFSHNTLLNEWMKDAFIKRVLSLWMSAALFFYYCPANEQQLNQSCLEN